MLNELEYLYHKIQDYQITPFLSIKHPTYKQIVEYGEEKYITLLYTLCLTPDDFKSELFDLGHDWQEVDFTTWFYIYAIPLLKNQRDNIIFTSDITMYQLYENKETKEIVLYNEMLDEILTEKHIRLIKEHINSMIGNMYKVHRERATNETTKKILIEEDRFNKKINARKEKHKLSVEDIIIKVLYDKYFENDIDTIRERCGISINKIGTPIANIADYAYRYGERDIIEKIAEKIYKELKEN